MDTLRRAFQDGGIKGVNEHIEDEMVMSRGASSFWELIQRMSGIPEFAKELQKVEERITTDSMGAAFRELVEKLGIEIKCDRVPEWLRTMGQPVLAYGNHSARIEPLLFGAFVERDDMAAIGGGITKNVGPNFGRHILPVFPKKYAHGSGKSLTLGEKIIYGEGSLSKEEVEELNRKSLEEAGERLGQGQLIGIFPTATDAITGEWRAGLGRIIKSIPSGVDLENILLAPVHFGPLRGVDFLSNIRRVFEKGVPPKPQPVEVIFGEELRLGDLSSGDLSAEELTRILKEDYLGKFDERKGGSVG